MTGVPQSPVVHVSGREWLLFSIDYDTADGRFSTYIYALSLEHAHMMVEELKQTARVGGQFWTVKLHRGSNMDAEAILEIWRDCGHADNDGNAIKFARTIIERSQTPYSALIPVECDECAGMGRVGPDSEPGEFACEVCGGSGKVCIPQVVPQLQHLQQLLVGADIALRHFAHRELPADPQEELGLVVIQHASKKVDAALRLADGLLQVR